jgi:hypothetical protein
MRTKQLFTLFALCVLVISFACLCEEKVSADVKYLGSDESTQGDWIGKYGADGAIIFCNAEYKNVDLSAPYKADPKQKLIKEGLIKELTIYSDFEGKAKAYGWVFNASPPKDEKRSPLLVDGSARYAGCVSGRAAHVAMTLTVNSTQYKVAIYCLDYDTGGARKHEVFGFQGKDIPQKPDATAPKGYNNGVYYIWEVTGGEPFKFYQKNLAGSVNSVSSGIFVDATITTSVKPLGKLPLTWCVIKSKY